jgi:hypothetical protein
MGKKRGDPDCSVSLRGRLNSLSSLPVLAAALQTLRFFVAETMGLRNNAATPLNADNR